MITLTVKMLRSLKEKSIGLIGNNPVYPVYFTTRWGIHTFGVLCPIDIIILDDTNTVVTFTKSLPPNRIFIWNPKHKHVVELPEGMIEKHTITRGTVIRLLF